MLQGSTEGTAEGRNLQACIEASLQGSAAHIQRGEDSVQQITRAVRNYNVLALERGALMSLQVTV
jgi:hypothetical protein